MGYSGERTVRGQQKTPQRKRGYLIPIESVKHPGKNVLGWFEKEGLATFAEAEIFNRKECNSFQCCRAKTGRSGQRENQKERIAFPLLRAPAMRRIQA